MSVKRRTAAVFAAMLLLLQLVPASVSADETIYFTAVNETVLELSDTTMPFWSGGYLYVASSIFSGKELGVFYSRNAAKQVVVLYTRNSDLVFNMKTRTMTDGQGNEYSQSPIEKNGEVFIPINTVAQFFGLTYSTTRITITTAGKTVNAYLIRVKSSSAILSDKVFTDAAATQLLSRYDSYSSSKETRPSSPFLPPTEEETPVTPEPAVVTGKKIYLCFAVRSTAAAEDLLDLLNQYQMQATFYFPPDVLEGADDLLRRMVATGQGIGFLSAADEDGQWLEKLKEANALLMRAAGEKTRLILPVGASAAQLQKAEGDGWYRVEADLNRAERGLTTASGAATLLKKVEDREDGAVIWLDGNVTAAGLKAFLAGAETAKDRCLAVTETVS